MGQLRAAEDGKRGRGPSERGLGAGWRAERPRRVHEMAKPVAADALRIVQRERLASRRHEHIPAPLSCRLWRDGDQPVTGTCAPELLEERTIDRPFGFHEE